MDWKVTTLVPDFVNHGPWSVVSVERIPVGANLQLPVGPGLLVIEPAESNDDERAEENAN